MIKHVQLMSDLKNSTNIISSNDLKWLLNAILKNWLVFLIVLSISAILGWLYNYKQITSYQTKIEILLKSNDVYNYQENLYSNLGFYNYYGDISNQKRIIGSYDMLQNVLKKLDLSSSYYIVGRLNTKEFFEELPFKVNVKVFNPNLYDIPIDFKIINNQKYQLSFKANDQEIVRTHYFDSLETNIYYSINTNLLTNFNNERSKTVSEINYQIKFHRDQYWINKIISNLNIENIEYTSLLVINLLN